MIPKQIHYVWLGGPMPDDLKKYVKTWETKLPEYEIKEWTLNNWPNIDKYPFVKECIKNNMYAHASDVIRLDILYNYGGIYLDTDVSVHQTFDPLLKNTLFIGRIYRNLIGTAVIGSEKGNLVINSLLLVYKNLTINEVKESKYYDTNNSTFTYFFLDNYSEFVLTNINQVFDDGTAIYKKEYFEQSSLASQTNFAVHHYKGSWRKSTHSSYEKLKQIVKLILPNFIYGQISSSRGAYKNRRFDLYHNEITSK